jgi:hypothetical protein
LFFSNRANERFVNLGHLAFAANLHGEITVTPGLAEAMWLGKYAQV